jgi:hypothetical protein
MDYTRIKQNNNGSRPYQIEAKKNIYKVWRREKSRKSYFATGQR